MLDEKWNKSKMQLKRAHQDKVCARVSSGTFTRAVARLSGFWKYCGSPPPPVRMLFHHRAVRSVKFPRSHLNTWEERYTSVGDWTRPLDPESNALIITPPLSPYGHPAFADTRYYRQNPGPRRQTIDWKWLSLLRTLAITDTKWRPERVRYNESWL